MTIAYQQIVNYFISEIFNTTDIKTVKPPKNTRLTPKYVSQAWRHSNLIVNTARQVAESCTKPEYRGGLQISAQQMKFCQGTKTFDLDIAISSLKSYKLIHLLVKKTKHLNTLLAIPGAVLKEGGYIKNGLIRLCVEIPDTALKTDGQILGIDIGIKKLIADSNHQFYGRETKAICQKVVRRKPGSKGKLRARKHRDQYFARTVKQLPWQAIKVLGIENLTGMKVGKSKNRGRNFRRQTAPWSYCQVTERLKNTAELNRVQLVTVSPAHTSQTCPIPQCGRVSRDNRLGEEFKCVSCGYEADADYVGALNVLAKTTETLGSMTVP